MPWLTIGFITVPAILVYRWLVFIYGCIDYVILDGYWIGTLLIYGHNGWVGGCISLNLDIVQLYPWMPLRAAAHRLACMNTPSVSMPRIPLGRMVELE